MNEPTLIPRAGWVRQYPPLASLGVALLITVLVLPNALHLPQSNPSTVLEYAPVPPEDDTPPPDIGSMSSLGLGTSSGLKQGANTPKPNSPKTGGGNTPQTKRCVGKPLRQTEDPNSPPCVPFFDGDNGGETWQGVTGDEIRVLVYSSAYTTVPDTKERRSESTPSSPYCDVDGPPDSDPGCLESLGGEHDHAVVRITRAYSRYFNERFQTYGRHVHFFIFWSGADSAAARRADAAGNWDTLKPFAVLDLAFFGGYNEVYAESMTKRRTSVYGSFQALANEYYRRNAPLVWSFWPDVEHAADMYVSYVCTKVAPYPVSHSGNAGQNGRPRRYAFLYTNDDDFAGLRYFAELAKAGLRNCPNGAKLDVAQDSVVYSRNQYQVDSSPVAAQEAQNNVAKMKGSDVTTVLWLGGYETQHSLAAKNSSWFPEWVVAGDGLNDAIDNGRAQEQSVWRHAWFTSTYLKEDKTAGAPGRQAFREAEPNGDPNDEDEANARYRSFFTLFKAIQVAGPELTPASVDQGHHAIPHQSSSNPYVAACFYDPGDYTCVKDATELWWDPDANDPAGNPNLHGCYRMVRGGQRFLPGTWPGDDRDVFFNYQDPCNSVTSDAFLATPADN